MKMNQRYLSCHGSLERSLGLPHTAHWPRHNLLEQQPRSPDRATSQQYPAYRRSCERSPVLLPAVRAIAYSPLGGRPKSPTRLGFLRGALLLHLPLLGIFPANLALLQRNRARSKTKLRLLPTGRARPPPLPLLDPTSARHSDYRAPSLDESATLLVLIHAARAQLARPASICISPDSANFS